MSRNGGLLLPVLHLGSIALPTWHLMAALGSCAAFVLFLKQFETKGGPSATAVFVPVYVAGIVGARVCSICLAPGPPKLFGDLTLYGGLFGGAIALWVLKRPLQLELRHTLNSAGIPMLLGIGVGRIGCFLNGDDYGIIWTWAIENELPIHRVPVQLLESAGCLAAARILWRKPKSNRLANAACSYAVLRFFLEYLRGDDRGPELAGLSPSQVFSIAVLLFLAIKPTEQWRSSGIDRYATHPRSS